MGEPALYKLERELRELRVHRVEFHDNEYGPSVRLYARNADMTETCVSRDSLQEALEALDVA